MCLGENTTGHVRNVVDADEVFVEAPPLDDHLGSLAMYLAEDTMGDGRCIRDVVDAAAAAADEAFVEAPPPDDPACLLRADLASLGMCLVEDMTGDECHFRDDAEADDEAFVRAPPSDDPACLRRVDKLRVLVETWVEGVRAEAGRPALSAAMYRRWRAADHLDIALEFAQRRKVGLEHDDLCWFVQDAMGAEIVDSCAYCGCNFSVVAVVDMPEVGIVCGVCGRRFRVHDPAPLVRVSAIPRWTPRRGGRAGCHGS